jgi:hypothetical protein
VRARDSGGRWGYSQIVLVTVENHLSVKITSPAAGSVVSGLVTVEFQVTVEPGETVSSVEVSFDGGDWAPVTNPPTSAGSWADGSHDWDTASLTDGSHVLTVRASDSHGRVACSLTRLALVDNTAPLTGLPVVTYPFGQTVAQTGDEILVEARVDDVIAGVAPGTVVLDSAAVDGATHVMADDGTQGDVTAADGVYSCIVTVSEHADGVHGVSVTAADLAGNAATAATGHVTVRNSAEAAGCTPGGSDSRGGWGILAVMACAVIMIARRRLPTRSSAYRRSGPGPHRRAVAKAALTLALLAAAGPAFAYDSFEDSLKQAPLAVTGTNFLQGLVLVPPMEGASVLPSGGYLIEFGASRSRDSYVDSVGTSSVDTDAELDQTLVRLAYGLTDRIELRLAVPYVAWDGRLDAVKGGESIFDRTDLRAALGGASLGAKFALKEGWLAGTFAMKLASGSTLDYASTGAADFAVGVVATKPGRVALHGSLSATFPGAPEIFRDEADVEFRNVVFHGGLGVSFAANDRLSLVCQIEGGDSAMETEGLDGLEPFREGPWRMVFGLRSFAGKAGFELGAGARLNDSGSDWLVQGKFLVGSF